MRELGSRLSAHNSSMGRLLRQARETQEQGELLRASVRELEGRGRQLFNLSEALRQRLEEVAADKAEIQGRLEQLESRVRQALQARPAENQSAKDLGALQVSAGSGGSRGTRPHRGHRERPGRGSGPAGAGGTRPHRENQTPSGPTRAGTPGASRGSGPGGAQGDPNPTRGAPGPAGRSGGVPALLGATRGDWSQGEHWGTRPSPCTGNSWGGDRPGGTGGDPPSQDTGISMEGPEPPGAL